MVLKHFNVTSLYVPLLLTASLLSACSPVSRMMLNPDPSASLIYLQENNLGYQDVAPEIQIKVCEGYLSIKRFSDFRLCMDNYRARVPAPEIIVWHADMKPGPANDDYAAAYEFGMRAQAALDLGEYDKAKRYADIAYRGARGKPSRWTHESNSYWEREQSLLLPRAAGVLAIIAAMNGDTDRARELIKEIEAIDASGFMANYAEPYKLSWVGRSYLAIGEPQNAYRALTNSELSAGGIAAGTLQYFNYINPLYYVARVATGLNMEDYKAAANMDNSAMICRSLFDMQKWNGARECYQRLSEIPLISSFGNIYFAALHDLGSLALREKNWNEAITHLTKAIELLESQRSSITFDGQKMGFISERLSVYGKIIEAQLALGKTEKAFEYAERAKARALVDLLASKRNFGNQTPQTQQLIAHLDRASADALAASSIEGTRNIRGLKRKVKAEAPKLSSLTTVEAQTFAELTSSLSDNETLVEYFGSEERWYAFIIEKGRVAAIRLDHHGLLADVERFRKQLLQPENELYLETAQQLNNRLIAPLEHRISNTNLTIVSHGPLHYLPFNALHDGNAFLIDKYAIRLLPSTSVISLLEETPVKDGRKILVVGNPDLGDERFNLPAAQKEAEALDREINDSRLLLGSEATETAVKELGSNVARLHIASHGEFDSQQPLNSRLLLAPDDNNDGYLTVSDIYNLELNADLVTLSACETALGDITKGDDVVGLTRGFLYAGANSIVSSLWVVDDVATERLMVTFYSQLERLGKRDSLRSAQLSVKNNYREHPFYWAAFQLTGKQ